MSEAIHLILSLFMSHVLSEYSVINWSCNQINKTEVSRNLGHQGKSFVFTKSFILMVITAITF